MGICGSKNIGAVSPHAQNRQLTSGNLVLTPRPSNFMTTGQRANRVYLSGDDLQGYSMRQPVVRQVPADINWDSVSDFESVSEASTSDTESARSLSDLSANTV